MVQRNISSNAATSRAVALIDRLQAHSRFRNVASGADRVPNAVEFVGAAGATFIWGDAWEASLRVRSIGKARRIEDNSVRSDPTFTERGRLQELRAALHRRRRPQPHGFGR
jgi:hypothetical protein